MAQQILNLGTTDNDGTGTTLRAGGDMINDNFAELYGIWIVLSGTYASATTFTFTGTDKDAKLIQLSLLTLTDSAGTIRRIGYVKSAVNASGTITATVVTDTDLASGDKDFKVAYNRKVNDYLHLISIPGECIADVSYSQGVWMQDLQVDSYLLPVDASVLTAATGAGASCAFNIYKNTTALFSSAPDLTTNAVLRSQRPTTNTLTAAENISLRITASAGTTNKASDFQAKLFIVPALLFNITTYIAPFSERYIENIPGGEPSALLSDDGNRIDLFANNNYYTSTDGIAFVSQGKLAGIPNNSIRSHVCKYDGIYYYYGVISDANVHVYTSSDLLNWTDQGIVLSKGTNPAWDSGNIGNIFVWKEGTAWYMLYEAKLSGIDWQIGLATSSSPVTLFSKHATPVIDPINGGGNPELPRVNNEVVKYDGKYYCYYHRSTDGLIKRAYSTDLINWTEEGFIYYPYVPHAGFITFGDQCLIQFKDKTYLFFNPSNQVDAAHIDCCIDGRTTLDILSRGITVNDGYLI